MKTGTKIFVWILVAIGIVAFVFMGMVVTMMLAPGLEIFGVKYVSAKTGKYSYSNNASYTASNITLKTGEVPVEVTFGQSGSLGLEFVQHFQGFTKSADTANVKITNGAGESYSSGDSSVIIDVTEYKKFVWANSMQTYYLKLKLPSTYLATNSITIQSSRSDITFSGVQKNIGSLTLNTKGKIDIKNTALNITGDLTISSNSALTLGSNINISGNLVANMGNEDLTVTNSVGKDITFSSGAGSLNFYTCRNLTATTGSGNINKPKTNSISGNLIFNTNSGSVEIGSVLGSVNKVTSKTGFITLDNYVGGTLDISTQRSQITLGDVNNLSIITERNGDTIINSVAGNLNIDSQGNAGNVSCGNIGGDANISTKNGAISLSGTLGGNVTATTTGGSFTAIKAIAKNFTISTGSGAIKFVSCKDLNATIGNGSIACSNTELDGVVVSGKATISSNRGEIKLDSVGGEGNKINSQYGRVEINSIANDLTVDNCASAIYSIGTVDTLDFAAANGAITVGSIASSGKIKTSANVNVGGSGDVGNIDIKVNLGDVVLKNTVGTVKVASNRSINLENKSSTDIKINRERNIIGKLESTGRGSVVATGLQGSVYVYSAGKVDLSFAAVTDNVDVATDGAEKVSVLATNTRYNTVNYDLNTQTSRANCTVYYGDEVAQTSGSSTAINTNTGVLVTIKVKTSGAPIELKLAA